MKIIHFIGAIALSIISVGCASAKPTYNSYTDARDNKTYKTVKIGEQTWMAENLNYAAEGSVCYENKPAYCQKYGRLYDWETAMKACPNGWHLPSDADWDILMYFARDIHWEGGGKEWNVGTKFKAKSGWDGENGNGTDDYGFSALPGGRGRYGDFDNVGIIGYWWTATSNFDGFISMGIKDEDASLGEGFKNDLLSIRCVQD